MGFLMKHSVPRHGDVFFWKSRAGISREVRERSTRELLPAGIGAGRDRDHRIMESRDGLGWEGPSSSLSFQRAMGRGTFHQAGLL